MVGVIVAGGRGTRLTEITKDEIPKPMAKMLGKPVLERAIENLKKYGVNEIYITVGHLHQVIQNYFGDGSKFGVSIKYVVENESMGSAGALYFIKNELTDDFVVCSGDVVFDVDIDRLVAFHKRKGALITLVTHPNAHPYDSDLVVADKNACVRSINKKNSERSDFYKNNVNAGLFVVNADALDFFTRPCKVNMEHDFVARYIPDGKVYCYKTTEYIKDVGTPERFASTEKDLNLGLVAQKNLRNKQKAVFLDRDGVVNKYKGFISSSEDIELLPNVAQAVKRLNDSGYLTIIVSNQPVIARGESSFAEVDKMFDKIETLLGLKGAYIDGYYYCPHHPDGGFDGEVKELKFDCECRKPKIGMLLKAAADYNLELTDCVIIGDSDSDVQTGMNAGVKTIRVLSGVDGRPRLQADHVADDLFGAVIYLLGE